MVDDSTSPATKADLFYFMNAIVVQMENMNKEIENMNKEIENMNKEIENTRKENEGLQKDAMRHFDVVAETLDRDIRGAFRDHTSVNTQRFKDHSRRLTRLERHTGLMTR